jgi:hypothetical protein
MLNFTSLMATLKFCRVVEDYVVITFGSAIFKIIRLLFIAMLSVHFFACAFYRVKKESAVNQEDVENFYLARNTQSTVRAYLTAQILWK